MAKGIKEQKAPLSGNEMIKQLHLFTTEDPAIKFIVVFSIN